MAIVPPKPDILAYVERNLVQAEAQCVRLTSLIRCRKAKGRSTVVHERLLQELEVAIASVLCKLPLSAGD